MLWNYLRDKVRQSFLAGVQDALVELDGEDGEGHADATGLLRIRLQPALPAPAVKEEGRKGGKKA